MRKLFVAALLAGNLWGYAKKATVTFSGATNSTQTDITLAFSFSDIKLAYKTTTGGLIQNLCSRNGGTNNVPCDFAFSDDTSCATITGSYTWGFDGDYDSTAGTGHGWVKVPSYTTSGVTPTVCIDDASVSTYQGGAAGSEFDSSTKLAYHMSGSGSTLTDFSSSGNDGTKKSSTQPSATTSGQIGDAQTFVGTISSTNNDYVTFGSPTTATNTYTLEAWVNQSSNVDHPTLYYVWASLVGSHVVGFGTTWFPAPVTMKYFDNFNGNAPTAPASFNTGEWHHIVFVRNGDSANYYLDGVAGTAKTGLGTGTQTWIGLGYSGAAATLESVVGAVDEVRYSNVARGSDWIATEEANQSSPPAIGSFTDTATGPPNSQSVIF